MGLPQSDLLPIQKSIQAIEISHSRRILSDLPLQPQIRDSATQRSSTAKDQHPHFPKPSPYLRGQSDLGSDGDLASRGLSVLGQAQSSVAALAAVGHQTLNPLDSSTDRKSTRLNSSHVEISYA